ncbi:VanW family protein [Paenimyroides aestuarii]|uniref:VanW family protein n=1 Tax=Paenimyroides aestuarii TaxID=2968490 RepID=A0ABY5NPH7_9FLAO|nr:VanW family protein [Paenimyroides aestuarii]UUV20404.1 VanW family protein [Paenimyroides aestuarii]
MKQRKLLSQRHPILYFLAVWTRRLKRKAEWFCSGNTYSKLKPIDSSFHRVKKHQSVLLRKLGDGNQELQINKVTNLRIALKQLNGVVIKPGETFSFCKLVGLPTKKKGYLLGMELSFGKARAGIGGGICQIANMIHWLATHSPLTVTERSNHSFDPFPDEGRVLPFGSGAAIFYNYVDLQIKNNTDNTFQLNLWLTDTHLEGELKAKNPLGVSYHIFEKNHQFLKKDTLFFRQNEIWRKVIDKKTGNCLKNELLKKNYARVTYQPENYINTNLKNI